MAGEEMSFLNAVWKTMDAMEIPPDTSPGCSYLQLYGNRQLKLENYTRIIDYNESRLLLQCKTCQMEISGRHLLITQYTGQQLTVAGQIIDIQFR